MPRRMSFAMTTNQIIARSKFVTRRFGWWNLKPGDVLWAVEKSMGLKKGEKTKYLDSIEVVDVRREPLNAIDQSDCVKEGFPDMTPNQFVEMLVKHYKINPNEICNRIQFRYSNKLEGGLSVATQQELFAPE